MDHSQPYALIPKRLRWSEKQKIRKGKNKIDKISFIAAEFMPKVHHLFFSKTLQLSLVQVHVLAASASVKYNCCKLRQETA